MYEHFLLPSSQHHQALERFKALEPPEGRHESFWIDFYLRCVPLDAQVIVGFSVVVVVGEVIGWEG
jgi:hypothetical protein